MIFSVREVSSHEFGDTLSFVYLGKVNYIEHPMSINR